ncbi:MAG: glycosyltransferase family 4 protein [Chitinophagaceae bacterium]
MKILWLTNTPCGASDYFRIKYPLGGWMSSLEDQIKIIPDVTLAVSFFYNNCRDFKFIYNSVTYYPIKDKKSTLIGKISSKLLNKLCDTNLVALIKVIEDFKPDIIQLFGTESGLGEIIKETKIPVIIHIQGLINPCVSAWFPKGISQSTFDSHSRLIDILSLRGFGGTYQLFKKMALREEQILKSAHYFFGRTEWDMRTVKIYNSKCRYFHCEELLRSIFFEHQWKPNNTSTIRLVTTIHPNTYKGIEIILETAAILKKKTALKFEWVIIGVSKDSQLVGVLEKIKKMRFEENSVVMKGRKTGNEVITELLKADIFIHPSHMDTSPNSVCEAMLLGMPVIAGNVGGVPSLIRHNVNGILFNSHDPFELAGIILEKAGKPLQLQRLGDNARKLAYTRHNSEAIVSVILATYKNILSEQQSYRDQPVCVLNN